MSHLDGFTLVELLVVMAILTVLMGLILSAVSRARASAARTDCVARLHQMALGFTLFASENGGRLPDPAASETSWEHALAKYVGSNPQFFQCRADPEIFPTIGSSYDWRDTGAESTTLAGRKITDVNRPMVVLVFEALPGWHAKKMMNAARIDGSAEQMDQESCLRDLQTPIR